MASANSSTGFQTLMEAEKESAKVVAKARQYRVSRLKDAKLEAQKEIEQLKAQKEKEFQDYMANANKEEMTKSADDDMLKKLKNIDIAFEKNKETVISKVLETVTRVDPKIHGNYKLRQ